MRRKCIDFYVITLCCEKEFVRNYLNQLLYSVQNVCIKMNKCNATRDKAITMTGDFLAREMTIDRMRVCLSSYSPALANIPPHSTINISSSHTCLHYHIWNAPARRRPWSICIRISISNWHNASLNDIVANNIGL